MKNIDDYTNEEFLNLDSEERLRLIMGESSKEDQRVNNFWNVEYPNLSIEERTKYWAGDLFRIMRWQEESQNNPYIIFSESWLRETIKLEPNIIEMLPQIYNIWGGMFDANKVDRIIQKHLRNIKKK